METAVQTNKTKLLSKDSLMLGGISVLMWAIAYSFADTGAATVNKVALVTFHLSFLLNFPHFLSSYLMLYGDFKKSILTKPRYFWAAVIVPTILINFLAYAVVTGNKDYLSGMIQTMFLLVGWHYVKQVFGCMIVSSAREKIYYSKWERRALLFNLFTLWPLSILHSQMGTRNYNFYGINYASQNLPEWPYQVNLGISLVSLAVVAGLFIRKYVTEGKRPAVSGLVAFFALYIWYIPVFAHPAFAYFIPAFHSLQYLGLVWTFKKNQVASKVPDLATPEHRWNWIKSFWGFFAGSALLGAGVFQLLPYCLDQLAITPSGIGTQPVMAAFMLFLNIHHYFIDNVIWRSDNADVKQFLFAAPKAPEVKAVAVDHHKVA